MNKPAVQEKRSGADALYSALPSTVLAAAIINGQRKLLDGHQEMAWRALSNLWCDVSPHLLDALRADPSSKLATAALVLETYFGSDGDWKRMERELTKVSAESTRMPPVLLEALIQKLGTQFANLAREMAGQRK